MIQRSAILSFHQAHPIVKPTAAGSAHAALGPLVISEQICPPGRNCLPPRLDDLLCDSAALPYPPTPLPMLACRRAAPNGGLGELDRD
jgi:hypothetical protein